MTHFMSHIGVPIARDWWPVLGNPMLTADVQEQIVEGVNQETEGRSVAALAAERDRCLIAILEALQRARAE